MATQEQIGIALRNAHKAGDVAAARQLAAAYKAAGATPTSKGPTRRGAVNPPPREPGRWGGFGTGIRDVAISVAGTVDILQAPMAGFANLATDAVGLGTPFTTATELARVASDQLNLKEADTGTGQVVSGVNRALSGTLLTAGAGMTSTVVRQAPRAAAFLADDLPFQLLSAGTGATTGGMTAEVTDNPLVIGGAALLGSALPGATRAGVNTWRERGNDDEMARLLLRDRDDTLLTGADDVQAGVRRDYEGAMRPFEAEYANLDNLDRPRYTPAPEVNPVEWGMPIQQASRQVPASRRHFGRVLTEEANHIIGESGVEAAIAKVERIDTSNLTGMKDARSILLSKARAATEPNQARVLRRLGESIQQDMDDTLLDTAARDLSARYRRDVIAPFDDVRQGGVLQPGADPSTAWKAIRSSSPEAKQRLARAASPATSDVIRRRAIADIIAREEQQAGLFKGGSGHPVWRQMDDKGMGAFFTPDEWRGLRRLTAVQAVLKNPITKGFAAMIGFGSGDLTGAGGVLLADWLASTPQGRLFLSRSARMSSQAARETTQNLLANPGTLQAQIQTAKDREDSSP